MPWHGGFLESLIPTVKLLLKKQWKTYGQNYEQMQNMLQEIEAIVNNRLLTYVYPTELETCITPNHLLLCRTLSFSNLKPAPLITESSGTKLYSSKILNVVDHFWEKWQKPNDNFLTINIEDIVVVHEKFQLRMLCGKWELLTTL